MHPVLGPTQRRVPNDTWQHSPHNPMLPPPFCGHSDEARTIGARSHTTMAAIAAIATTATAIAMIHCFFIYKLNGALVAEARQRP